MANFLFLFSKNNGFNVSAAQSYDDSTQIVLELYRFWRWKICSSLIDEPLKNCWGAVGLRSILSNVTVVWFDCKVRVVSKIWETLARDERCSSYQATGKWEKADQVDETVLVRLSGLEYLTSKSMLISSFRKILLNFKFISKGSVLLRKAM